MLSTAPRRYGSFLIKGKAHQISAQLAAMAARGCGRVPNFDPEGEHHEIRVNPCADRSSLNLPAAVPQKGDLPAFLRRRRILLGPGNAAQVIGQLRAEIARMEGKASC